MPYRQQGEMGYEKELDKAVAKISGYPLYSHVLPTLTRTVESNQDILTLLITLQPVNHQL